MNIVDLIKGQLGAPSTLDKIASAVGLDSSSASKAMGAALPALLGTLGSVVSTPDGARKLNDAVDKADDGILSNLTNSLTGGGVSSLLSGGSSILSSLLGGGVLGGLVAAITKFTGLGNTAVSGMLGLLTPMVLGALKGQKKSQGLDASGLVSMLAGQKGNIAAAMPAGLGSMLGALPGMSMFADSGSRPEATRTVETHREPVRPVDTYRAPEPASASPMRWLLPLLLLAGLGLLAWSFLGKGKESDREAPGSTGSFDPVAKQKQIEATVAAPIQAAAAALPAGVTSFFTDAQAAITGITNVDSAKAALPALTKLADGVAALKPALDAVPADAKSGVMSLLGSRSNALIQALDKVEALPGVGEVIKPVTGKIRDGIKALGM